MRPYLREVGVRLERLSRTDRRIALDALDAQLGELQEANIDPVEALGTPEEYAMALLDALSSDTPIEEPALRVLGLPLETRGPMSAEVRSRVWNPESPRLVVPRLFGIGWTLNLGALAVKLRLIRPDDATGEVVEQIPECAVRTAQLVPLLISGVTVGTLALAWRRLPNQVASGFNLWGGQSRTGSKRSLIGVALLGVAPALWAARKRIPSEDRLVRVASATTLATVSASTVAASILKARRPRGRWGLLVPASLPLGVALSLGVIILPLRAGLRRVWHLARATSGRARDE
ncbi:DUF5808 domain-containing protein [Lysinibacter sp. HNR]|uniref:DUF5808 domain-containing protein n=1 Tax=Lysinibacter sp. HNR TaxID=3031408 RepID=UPI002434FA34|nr:DUF5808 domain-containing protein [Lysinibacter sp. HNR]WGD38456.1 DUF5808 domain-containing protein [Lysinibacter sp. HNR]